MTPPSGPTLRGATLKLTVDRETRRVDGHATVLLRIILGAAFTRAYTDGLRDGYDQGIAAAQAEDQRG